MRENHGVKLQIFPVGHLATIWRPLGDQLLKIII